MLNEFKVELFSCRKVKRFDYKSFQGECAVICLCVGLQGLDLSDLKHIPHWDYSDWRIMAEDKKQKVSTGSKWFRFLYGLVSSRVE